MSKKFKGSLPALVTPLRDGKVDTAAFAKLIDWQIEQGSHGLVVGGTTGEAASLDMDERAQTIEMCVEKAAGRVPVMAGVVTNKTHVAVELARHVEKAGADAALVLAPYYTKPDQRGLYRHFMEVRAALGDIPVLFYNLPARTGVDVTLDTLEKLYREGAISGIKDGSGDVRRVAASRPVLGEGFIQLCGNDDIALGFMAYGGDGCISVTGNVAPAACAEVQNACMEKDFSRALKTQDKLVSLHNAVLSEAFAASTKYGLSLQGICSEEVRLPLLPPTEGNKQAVRDGMTKVGIKFAA